MTNENNKELNQVFDKTESQQVDRKVFADFVENYFEKNIKQVLFDKNRQYAKNNDVLSNFNFGASLQECTPERCLFGYLTKHITSLSEMCNSGFIDFYPKEMWNEKITDSINYLILLRYMVEKFFE